MQILEIGGWNMCTLGKKGMEHLINRFIEMIKIILIFKLPDES